MELYNKERPTGIEISKVEEEGDDLIVLESDKQWWRRYPKKHFSVR